MKDLSSLMKQAQQMQEKLGAAQAELVQKAAGPLAGMPGMPKF